ncbi:MAG: preprotein translocase subunit SecE [Bacillota bacterium]|jgi:preprotein translocase subunit SecE|nr:preprotein translocase subunit SecE [Bacillota bacterium]HOB42352.1 preprotein translocase subunit SecE [Bacillota bacterium]HOK70185.1 preprotein translocase subunit SecE [Bacillota bacterium]HOL51368.1 preprotein translocase subunit SecE [Bacillota bacterium]HOO31358.1 preprotein translocase subunit SecE [Bacillota bacterium]
MAQEAKPTLSTRMKGFFGKIGKFFREVRAEFKRVQWPSRKETWSLTLAVIVYVLIVTVFLGLVDLGLSFLVEQIVKAAA